MHLRQLVPGSTLVMVANWDGTSQMKLMVNNGADVDAITYDRYTNSNSIMGEAVKDGK